MKVKTTAAITALKKFTHWVKGLKSVDEDAQNEAVNIVIGCFYVLEASPTADVRAWMNRQPQRERLKNAAKAAKTQVGRRAIAELIEITMLELEASKPFLKEVDVGPLPMEEPRRLTQKHIAALHRGRNKWHQTQGHQQAEVYCLHGAKNGLAIP